MNWGESGEPFNKRNFRILSANADMRHLALETVDDQRFRMMDICGPFGSREDGKGCERIDPSDFNSLRKVTVNHESMATASTSVAQCLGSGVLARNDKSLMLDAG